MSTRPNPRSVDELLAHAAWIGALARSLVRDPSTADDLVQQTWMAALSSPPSGDKPLRPWLARVLHNFALQRKRSESRREQRESSSARDHRLPSAGELASRAQEQRDLVQCVLDLDEPYRSTILLHYFEGLSLSDIARERKLSANSVRTHHKRGLERLRAELDRRHGGDRASWAALLAPLARGSAASTAVKLGVAAATIVVCAWTIERCLFNARSASNDTRTITAQLETDRDAAAGLPTMDEMVGPPAPAPDVSRAALLNSNDGSAQLAPHAPRLHGILVDSQTSDPVPDCLFELTHNGRVETLHSDMLGRFDSDAMIDDGELVVRAVDEHLAGSVGIGTKLEYRAPPAGVDDELRLRVNVGPSWRLHFVGAPDFDPESCEAALVHGKPSRYLASANVRAGDPPWVRFASWNGSMLPSWTLAIRTRDQMWAGGVEVDASPGAHGIVDVRMHARAKLSGVIRDPQGEPVAQAKVWIAARDSGRLEDAIAWDDSGGNGRYAIGCLDPGPCTLHVQADGFGAGEQWVELTAGRELALDVTLGQPVAMGPVRGVVRSQSGRLSGQRLFASLVSADGSRRRGATVAVETRGDGDVGTFAFDAVPLGEYTLSLSRREFDWSPADAHVSVPATDIEFVYMDLEPMQDLALDVVDRDTGAKLERYSIQAWFPGMSRTGTGPNPAANILNAIPRTRSFHFFVVADGHQPFTGDEASFGAQRERNPLRIELERGWGACFRVEDARLRPIAGAQVSLDGQLAGTTDASGLLIVRRTSTPVRASVVAEGYDYDWGSIDAATGEIRLGFEAGIDVFMRPR
jgi:RNA polymerase sigma-70 factor (ECF subfamily)